MKLAARVVAVALSLSVAVCVFAQTPETPRHPSPLPQATINAPSVAKPQRPDFGTVGATYKQYSALSFVPLNSTTVWSTTYPPYSGQVLRTTTGSFQTFAANLDLPQGALLTYLELDGCDNTGGSGWVQGSLVVSDAVGNASYAAPFLASDGSGCHFWAEDLTSANIVIDNFNNHYWLLDYVSYDSGFTTGLVGMVVGYRLQVPPAPVTSDFTDVPTSSPQFQFIEALYHAGITAGCGGGNYCPNNPLTRGQMAVFLAKALGLHQ